MFFPSLIKMVVHIFKIVSRHLYDPSFEMWNTAFYCMKNSLVLIHSILLKLH